MGAGPAGPAPVAAIMELASTFRVDHDVNFMIDEIGGARGLAAGWAPV
jgi:hypothetical protein